MAPSEEQPIIGAQNGKLTQVMSVDSRDINDRQNEQASISYRSRRKWTTCQKLLVLLCFVLFVALLFMVVIHFYGFESSKEKPCEQEVKKENRCSNATAQCAQRKDPDQCTTAQCVQIAAQIINYMDSSVDPCEDFYNYACGGWFKMNTIPESKPQWDVFQELNDARNKLLRNALETKTPTKGVETKLFGFYSSCLNTTAIEIHSINALNKAIQDVLGGSPIVDTTWNSSSFQLLRNLQSIEEMTPRNMYMQKVVPFFDTKVIADIFNSTYNTIEISPPEMGIYDPTNYIAPYAEQTRKAYKTAMRHIIKSLGASKDDATKWSNELMDLEVELAKIMPTPAELRQTVKVNKRMTIEELTKQTHGKFDWFGYLSKVMKPVDKKLTSTDMVTVRSLKYMKQAVKILDATPKSVLANYFTWSLILNMIEALPKVIRDAHFKFFSAITGIQRNKPRWETCIDKSEAMIGMALGALFAKEKFDPQTKGDVESLIEMIKSAFLDVLGKTEWMDEETKRKAEEKAKAMIGNIAFPSYVIDEQQLEAIYKDVTHLSEEHFFQNIIKLVKNKRMANLRKIFQRVDREEWAFPPTIVNAFYDPVRNKMVFLAGVLQPPFYSWKGPKSVNFGGIGMVMGHELTHGFDDQGRLYDKNGDLKEWWSNSSTQNFKKKTKCMVERYSNYSLYGVNINGQLTLGENIADQGGLLTSFKAYQKWLKENGDDIRLPGLSLSNEQLFFLASSQIWCSLDRKKMVIANLNTESHMPGIYRVFGMLSNNKDFSKAFSCKKGQKMNPVDKCTVW